MKKRTTRICSRQPSSQSAWLARQLQTLSGHPHFFLSTHPNITMTVDALAQVDIEAGLMHDRFDLGIAPSHPESTEISGTSVGEEHLSCVVSPDHPCADLLSIDSQVLSTLKLALF